MKKVYLVLAAVAGLTVASCTTNDYVGEVGNKEVNDGSIQFGTAFNSMTRATQEDAEAAATLGSKFVVWGEKNEATTTTATAAANMVFKNYVVVYGASTANTTTSNTDDWEYVGKSPYTANVTPAAPTTQSIKYWDNSASNYVFTAFSAKDADVTAGNVIVAKTETGTTKYDKGYTVSVKAGADLSKLFFADRIEKTTKPYSGPVKFTFRNFQTKISFAMYETIPGYKVKVKQVKYNGAYSTTNFGVDGKFLVAGDNTTYTVTYGNGTTTGPENKVLVAADASSNSQTYLQSGTSIISAAQLGTTSSAATAEEAIAILPYPGNTTNLKFVIDYTLISEDTGETIEVTNKSAEVPAAYCKWQANYAYKYIFKITDTDLDPITFDACVVTDEIGNQETITTVEEPSITTFAVTSSTNDAVVAGQNEYATGNVIYASVVKGGAVQTLSSTNAKLYTVTTSNATTCPITEATVAAKQANTSASLLTITEVTSGVTYPSEIPDEIAGNTTMRTLSAMQWTAGASGTVYAVEFIDGSDKYYKIVRIQ